MTHQPLLLGVRFVLVPGLFLFGLMACASPEPDYSGLLQGPVQVKDVVLGPGDAIAISVYRHNDLDRAIVIPQTGTIFLPLVGEINVNGLTSMELRRTITENLADYVVDPQVSVIVTVRGSQKVVVLGEVRTPGLYTMSQPSNALEMIGRAGGFLQSGSKSSVILLRLEHGEVVRRILDLDDIIDEGSLDGIPHIQKGDVLYVPPTTVASIDRFASHVTIALTPVLMVLQGIRLGQDVERIFDFEEAPTQTPIIIVPVP